MPEMRTWWFVEWDCDVHDNFGRYHHTMHGCTVVDSDSAPNAIKHFVENSYLICSVWCSNPHNIKAERVPPYMATADVTRERIKRTCTVHA